MSKYYLTEFITDQCPDFHKFMLLKKGNMLKVCYFQFYACDVFNQPKYASEHHNR